MTTFDDYLKDKLRADSEYRREWERTEALYSAIGDTVHLRSVLGLTQSELAKRMGRKQPSIGRFEAGNTNPTLGFLQDVAEALGARLVVHIEPIEAVTTTKKDEPKAKRPAGSSKRRAGAAAYRGSSTSSIVPRLPTARCQAQPSAGLFQKMSTWVLGSRPRSLQT